MTLQQLRFLTAIVESDFNITAAAAKLNATQPAVSRQLLLLERELGFQIFSRNGRGLSRMTDAGEKVIEHARRALHEAQNIKKVSADLNDPRRGSLRIGSTQTEARYILPPAIRRFRDLFPGVRLTVHQGTPEQIAEMARAGRIDVAVAAGSRDLLDTLAIHPCHRSTWRVVVPSSHPLAKTATPSLAQLGAYPLAFHLSSLTESALHGVFGEAGIEPHIILTSRDAETIKEYARLNLGVGIIADIAFDADGDRDLAILDVSHLFPEETAWAGFPRKGVLRQYMYDFLRLLAPDLTRENIESARSRERSPAF